MITFETDDVLAGDLPDSLPAVMREAAADVAEIRLHDEYCTFFVPERAGDLADGGPISARACDGGSLAAAIADADPIVLHPAGETVIAVSVNRSGYYADVLLIPESDWIPDDIRQALAACRQGGDDA